MASRPSKPRRGPMQVSAASLEQAALRYLERFATSSGNLRRVLMRKVARAARVYGNDAASDERLVDDLIARYLRVGLLDDRAYAAQKAASLRRRGGSRYAIRGKLALSGIAGELIDEALRAEAEESELAAACALVRRRRLGPLRAARARAAHREKDLAALARAGFGLDLARRVLALRDEAALAALEHGEDQPEAGGGGGSR